MIRVLVTVVAAGSLAACGQEEAPAPSAAPSAVEATAAEHQHDAPTPSPPAEVAPRVPVQERELAYGEAGRRNLVGFLAMPSDAAEPLPGLIVIHEWWGLNDNIKAMTRRLAGEGYVALAVDLYGGATATTPEKAQALMTAVLTEPDMARANLRQAYEYLDKYALAPRVGSIGWCLGGGWSLQTALMLPRDLDAAVVYYGEITTDPAKLEPLEVPLLGLFGEQDASIPVRDVQLFRNALSQLGKNAEVLIFKGADHAFANPSGGNYQPEAATEAWEKTVAFLDHNLKLGAADASSN